MIGVAGVVYVSAMLLSVGAFYHPNAPTSDVAAPRNIAAMVFFGLCAVMGLANALFFRAKGWGRVVAESVVFAALGGLTFIIAKPYFVQPDMQTHSFMGTEYRISRLYNPSSGQAGFEHLGFVTCGIDRSRPVYGSDCGDASGGNQRVSLTTQSIGEVFEVEFAMDDAGLALEEDRVVGDLAGLTRVDGTDIYRFGTRDVMRIDADRRITLVASCYGEDLFCRASAVTQSGALMRTELLPERLADLTNEAAKAEAAAAVLLEGWQCPAQGCTAPPTD